MCPRILIALLVAAAMVPYEAALAAAVTPPCPLPGGIANFNHRLPSIYDQLTADQRRLNPPIEWFNGACTKGKIEKGSELDQKCGGVQAQSMQEWPGYEKRRKQYEWERAKAMRAAEIAAIDRRLATAKASLQRNAMRGGKLDQDIEEWVALQDDARKKAHDAVLDFGKEVAFRLYKQELVQRFPKARDELVEHVKGWPQFDWPGVTITRDDVIARLKDANTAAQFRESLNWMKHTVETSLAAQATAEKPRDSEKWANFVISFGTAAFSVYGSTDPLAKMIVQDAKLVVPVIYGWAVALSAEERYKEIAAIGEAQYADAKRLAALYEKDLRAKGDLAKKPVMAAKSCS